jgi:ketosteroid isomerase-like protein
VPGSPLDLFGRLVAAQNAHDVDAMAACFHDDYRSEQPLFPDRTFEGSGQVRTNWSAIFAAIPDFRGEVLRHAADGDTVFAELHWTGTKADGSRLDDRGVFIAGVRGDRIAWARIYVDEVHGDAGDVEQAVRRMAGPER